MPLLKQLRRGIEKESLRIDSDGQLAQTSHAAVLESVVDLHTFEPADLERMATNAGAVDVQTASEEFTAAMLGWPVRTFESTVPPGKLGWVRSS